MFRFFKSLFKKQPSKADLDVELQEALGLIRNGDSVEGVRMMEDRTAKVARSWPDSPIFAQACYNAAVANLVAGDNDQAVRYLEKATEIPGTDHESQKDRLSYEMNLGDVLTRTGRLEEAEAHLRTGLAEREEFYGDDHPGVAFGLTPLANNLLSQGRAAEALPLIDRAIEINRAAKQPEVADDMALRAFIVKSAQGPEAPAFVDWNDYTSALRTNLLYQILNRAEESEEPEPAQLAVYVLRELGQRLTAEQSLTDRVNVFVAISNAARSCDDHASRVQAGEQALSLAKESGNIEVVINICEGMGLALENAGQHDALAGMVRHDDLRERDYGDLTGLDKDETREKYGDEQVHIWRRSYDVPPPGGECLQDVVEKRVRPYYEANIKPMLEDGKNVLVAAHGNSLRAMLIIIGAETPDTINKAEMPTGVPLVFELENGEIKNRYFLQEKKAA